MILTLKRNERYLFKIIQLILGSLFVISGFLKGIDPTGVSYKLTEYFALFGLDFFSNYSIYFAIVLCAFELFIGLMLLTGICKKTISVLALLFMLIFTFITFYLFITPTAEIQECGCFGDALHLTNTETFLKNVIFVLLTIFYTWRQFKRVPSSLTKKATISILCYVVTISLFIPFYSYIFLPPFDFLPFNRGVHILNNINKETPEPTDKILLIYKNKQSGQSQQFSINDDTWRDTSLWEYVDTKIPETQPETNYLSKFVVMDANGNDCSSVVFDDSEYNFIIVARNIDNLRDADFQKIAPLYKLYLNGTINLYLFTSSELNQTNEVLLSHDLATIKAYNVDEVVLKSMIRNERGVMLVNKGIIIGKWNLKQNSFEGLDDNKLPVLVRGERTTILKYTVLLFLMVIVLFYLVFFKCEEKCIENKKERRESKRKQLTQTTDSEKVDPNPIFSSKLDFEGNSKLESDKKTNR